MVMKRRPVFQLVTVKAIRINPYSILPAVRRFKLVIICSLQKTNSWYISCQKTFVVIRWLLYFGGSCREAADVSIVTLGITI